MAVKVKYIEKGLQVRHALKSSELWGYTTGFKRTWRGSELLGIAEFSKMIG
jgi:hypothetical protein